MEQILDFTEIQNIYIYMSVEIIKCKQLTCHWKLSRWLARFLPSALRPGLILPRRRSRQSRSTLEQRAPLSRWTGWCPYDEQAWTEAACVGMDHPGIRQFPEVNASFPDLDKNHTDSSQISWVGSGNSLNVVDGCVVQIYIGFRTFWRFNQEITILGIVPEKLMWRRCNLLGSNC